MNSSSLQVPEPSLCLRLRTGTSRIIKWGIRGLNPLLLGALLFLLAFSPACGRHKAQVKAPRPTTPSTPKAGSSEPAPKQIPSAATKAPARGTPKTAPVTVPSKPDTAVPTPLPGISKGPLIRIGLITGAKEIRISSSGDYFLSEKAPESARQVLQGEIRARVEQEVEETSDTFRIQVASFARREAAEDLREKLDVLFHAQVTVRENSALGTNQVRVGAFQSREEAQALARFGRSPSLRGM